MDKEQIFMWTGLATIAVVVLNAFWLNRKLNNQKLDYDKQLEDYKVSTAKQLADYQVTNNKQLEEQRVMSDKKLEDYRVSADKQRKVSSIYYEERAQLLVKFYREVSLYYSRLFNMLHFLAKVQVEMVERPQVYKDIYQSLLALDREMGESALMARLYLPDEKSTEILDFTNHLSTINNDVVDIYEGYKRLDEKYDERLSNPMHRMLFFEEYSRVLESSNIAEDVGWMQNQGQEGIDNLKHQLKSVLTED